ncbi:GNAT family N-acetyltransferase [Fulvimonas yonginensis]|uniref:GNAT family N-acetyltransferase n=1 Tax=Fulvimonas yonginensis TaxID=1495200 RepID=A0ABU8JE35_9GAMM
MTSIRTGRLVIRPFTLDDAAFILRQLNEPSFVRHIADKGVRDLDGARGYLRDGPMASYARHGFGLWCVELGGAGTPIGMCGLIRRDYLPDIDIGYAFLPEYGGSGYAYEAAAAVLGHARHVLGVRRVLAIVNEDNAPSIRLLGKLGFEANGTVAVPGTEREVRLFAVHLGEAAQAQLAPTGAAGA